MAFSSFSSGPVLAGLEIAQFMLATMLAGLGPVLDGMANKKWRKIRTHDLRNDLAYVSTQHSGQVTMDTTMIEKKCVELA